MEIYGNSRRQDGGTSNEDAFLIGQKPVPHAALCDGSGNAGKVAKRALKILEGLVLHESIGNFQFFQTWNNWTHLLDSALLGGPQSTFLAVAILPDRVVGACAGDSRLYYLPSAGEIQILTEDAAKFRLGSGEVKPFPIHLRIRPGDILLLMSDGAWTPLNRAKLERLRGVASSMHFSEFPAMILDEAGKSGRADDMTVVAIRF
ncbi:MAG TPA: SpoIIE family protein phosphatase [Geothrix sp.]|nr:SpoIIE family protein phosphatase [Geothrix sp.]